MAEHASEAETEAEDRTGTARGAGRPARLLLAAGALAVAPDREPAAAEHVATTASPGPRSLACHGPLQVPDEALQKGGSVLLEPVMKVEVVSPEEYTGSVIGDLNSRRGQIQGQDMRGNANVINAMVPLMNMFGYVNNLRSMSQGRATFTMQFDHYAEAPANVSAEVQKKFA